MFGCVELGMGVRYLNGEGKRAVEHTGLDLKEEACSEGADSLGACMEVSHPGSIQGYLGEESQGSRSWVYHI